MYLQKYIIERQYTIAFELPDKGIQDCFLELRLKNVFNYKKRWFHGD